MLAFVEALYVSGFRDEVVALSPLVGQAMQVGPEWRRWTAACGAPGPG